MSLVASTALFRSLVILKDRKGPYLLFYVELAITTTLVVCLYLLSFARSYPDPGAGLALNQPWPRP